MYVPYIICLSHIHPDRPMGKALSIHGLSVTPIVGIISPDFKPSPNKNEVAAVFDIPLECFLQKMGHSHDDTDFRGLPYRLHYFELKSRERKPFLIWGLTVSLS